MKNKGLIVLSAICVLGMASCAKPDVSSSFETSSIQTSSSEVLTKSSISSGEISSQQSSTSSIESSSSNAVSSSAISSSTASSSSQQSSSETPKDPTTLQISLDVEKDSAGAYLLTYGKDVDIIFNYDVEGFAEKYTITATEYSLFFGETASTNVSINEDGHITLLGKASSIKVTATGKTSGLTATMNIAIQYAIDPYIEPLNQKFETATFKETTEASTGSFSYEGSKTINATFEVFSNESIESTNGDTYTYFGKEEDRYLNITKTGETTTVKTQASDINHAASLYYIATSSFNTYYGVSSYVKYLATSTNGFGGNAGKNASITIDGNSYSIRSYAVQDSFGTKSYSTYDLSFSFNIDGGLTSFNYTKSTYDQNGYDFSENQLIEGVAPQSREIASGSLNYGVRKEKSSRFDPSSLYVSTFSVDLKKIGNDESTTTFSVGDEISFSYGEVSPSTAITSFDTLSFVSSSDTSIIDMIDGKLKALKAGTSDLSFTTTKGATKTVSVTVVFSGIEEVIISDNLAKKDSIKINQEISGITIETRPHLDGLSYKLEVVEGSEFASVTSEADGTFKLKGLALGHIKLKASTTYKDEEYSVTKEMDVVEASALSPEQEFLLSKEEFIYRNLFNNAIDYTLSFTETSGTLNLLAKSTTITFDYALDGKTFVLSNAISTNSNITLTSLAFNADMDGITFVCSEQSIFGASPISQTLK